MSAAAGTTLAPAVFDPAGDLPTGTTVLEASAGTGKTWTIATLAARYVAEGRAELGELMIVTFGRAATQELRDRVRDRLLAAGQGLADPVAARASGDPLLALLADTDDAELALRRARLATALAAFDGATIATTHSFCQQMLAGLGIAGDPDADATLVESVDDVVSDTVDDVYLAKFARTGADEPLLDHGRALDVARAAVRDRQALLAPTDAEPGSAAGQRQRLAAVVRQQVQQRKRRAGLVDFDDLLTRLRDALADHDRGPVAQQRIRLRFRVVLVDEFQDTDPVQWEILRLAFHGHTTLVLIGDPKQAVYGFRGADVVTYLQAVADAGTQATLGRSWRSDEALVTALDAFFAGTALGDERIIVRPVQAEHAGRRIRRADGQPAPPLRLRVLDRSRGRRTRTGLLQVAGARQRVADDLAADVVRMLSDGTRLLLVGGHEGSVSKDGCPVRPGDIAVLVRTNRQGPLVRDALARAGVPAVLTGTTSVFATPSAREWLVLLQAVEQPYRTGLVRAAALTCFVGWSAERLAEAGDDALDELGPRLRTWGGVLAQRGVAALLEVVTVAGLTERLLGTVDGERRLTDLRHIAETMHEAAAHQRLGPAALVEWLHRRMAEAGGDTSTERSRRLESDADAVQIITVHRSKGLEFPIVLVPYGWDRWVEQNPELLQLHDDAGRRVLDVGGPSGPGWGERRRRHQAEEAGEDLRLLYVALTRAQCQVVTWWAPAGTTEASSVHRLLLGGSGAGQEPPMNVAVPDDDEVLVRLHARLDPGTGVSIESAVGEPAGRWQHQRPPDAALEVARLDRALDTVWRRTSYSAITAAAHDGPHPAPGDAGAAPDRPTGDVEAVGSEPEAGVLSDEPEDASGGAVGPSAGPGDAPLLAVASPMSDLPSGTTFGTLVHAVLETVDTGAANLGAELVDRCAAVLTVSGGAAGAVDGLAAALAPALLPVLRTPLGPLAGGRSLADVPPRDRLAELDFELPLAGGDTPAGTTAATVRDVAGLLRRHLPAGDPLTGYADHLEAPALRGDPLRGYLSGSIDAVLRVPGPDGAPRYLVVDYKTNRLGAPGTPLTAWHYRPAALTDAMVGAHYPLQALLYAVALHRYLRWRQPGYAPERHLGGTLYLFVRGMCGPGTPTVDGTPCGVHAWHPPASLVLALSDLLDGHPGAAPAGERP